MASIGRIRTWYLWHKWTSLICTLFLLLLCLTGLPLIFSDEIDHWLDDSPAYADLPADAPRANLDTLVTDAQRRYPQDVPRFIFIDDDEPQVVVTMSPNTDADFKLDRGLKYDAHSGKLLDETPPDAQAPIRFMSVVLSLHRDLFAGLPGELFLGLMGLLFVIAIVSGIVLYGPFMKKLDFGTTRRARGRRIYWLDIHNLLGITTLAWAFVVGVTGVMNELSTPLFGLWQMTEVKTILDHLPDKPTPQRFASVQTVYDTVSKALPGMTAVSIVYPNQTNNIPHHFLVWSKGSSTLMSRLFTPALVDAETAHLDVVARMPWYLRALELSRPLHFGDYGGTPAKILWVVFDLATIAVLISGLYLWFARRKVTAQRIDELIERHTLLDTAATERD